MVGNDLYKGSSSSDILFNLILRLMKLELEGGMILHVTHVSGKRMIVSEVDALSRGDITKSIIESNSLFT